MALDTIVVDGDKVLFDPIYGPASVAVKPGKIKATGKTTVKSKKVAIKGDEGNVEVSGCTYTSPAFPIPGTGNLKIVTLGPDQVTKKTKSGNKPVLIRGSVFIARFEVKSPAKIIPPGSAPVSDPTPFYMGTGKLIPSNDKVKVT
ncbi:hypothetical protein [Aquimarina mytili]|uniref:Uncharacterized protein n=1 Tax=Aquimarina mytili TaxID=874423 RepID=A0A937A3U5_9FLAO|nr:hypothetical protein [Aquimarina mytili]MBL0683869.1 hypothetical protein [Aquimarina mytili]